MRLTLRVCFLFPVLAPAAASDAGPRVRPFSFPPDVVRGQAVAVTCSVERAGAYRFEWVRGGEAAPGGQQGAAYSVLHLRAVDRERDAGEWTCEATDDEGRTDRHTATLVVHEWPEWRVAPPGAASVVAGEDLRVDCAAEGHPAPTVTWSHKGHGDRAGRVLSNGSLLLASVGAEEGGEWECVAKNGIGEGIWKAVTLTVHVPPRLQGGAGSVVRARSGHSAVLRCDVIGDSPLKVKWTRDYLDPKDTRYSVQETPVPGGLLSELFISRVTRKDAGAYACTAANAHGRMSANATTLVVLEPPFAPTDVTIRDVEKRRVRVTWRPPHPGNSPVTRYVLQYWRDTGSTPRLEEADADVGGGVLGGLRPGTPYVVRVVAENEFGPGPPSLPARFRTREEAPSGYPTDVTVVPAGPHALTVRWQAPAAEERNGAVTGYSVGVRPRHVAGPYSYSEAGHATHLRVAGLRPHAEYEVVVRARNAAGEGPASVPVHATTKETGGPLPLWVESVDENSIGVRWAAAGHEQLDSAVGPLRPPQVHKRWGSEEGRSDDSHQMVPI